MQEAQTKSESSGTEVHHRGPYSAESGFNYGKSQAWAVSDDNDAIVVTTGSPRDKAYAERISACLNLCKGVGTSQLQEMGVGSLLHQCDRANAERQIGVDLLSTVKLMFSTFQKYEQAGIVVPRESYLDGVQALIERAGSLLESGISPGSQVVIFLRESIGEKDHSAVACHAIKASYAEFFQDRIEFYSDATGHDQIDIVNESYHYKDDLYDFCSVYSGASLESLRGDYKQLTVEN